MFTHESAKPDRTLLTIMIPTKNGWDWLRRSLPRTTEYVPKDTEILVSAEPGDRLHQDFNSDKFPSVRVLKPSHSLSMVEHWDWVQAHATGRWQVFLGQDDALQPYFGEEFMRLIQEAERSGERAIVTRRAFAFWEGLEKAYGGQRARFEARPNLNLRNGAFDSLLALLNVRSYHHLPQAYGSSIVRSDLLEDVRQFQGGELFVTHPQDASLAASITRIEGKYLYSHTPIAWVGTSSQSAGLAVVAGQQNRPKNGKRTSAVDSSEALARSYSRSIKESRRVVFPDFAGDFSLGENSIYFWQALQRVNFFHQKPRVAELLLSRPVVFLVLAAVWSRLSPPLSERKRQMLRDVALRNRLNPRGTYLAGRGARTLVHIGLYVRSLLRKKRLPPVSQVTRRVVPDGYQVSSEQMPELDFVELERKSMEVYRSQRPDREERTSTPKLSLNPLPQ